MVTALIERCRLRHRSHDGRLQGCRRALMLVLCAAIVSVVLFTSTIWRRDKVSAPYTQQEVMVRLLQGAQTASRRLERRDQTTQCLIAKRLRRLGEAAQKAPDQFGIVFVARFASTVGLNE